jgi:hypothetical protein
VSGWPLVQRSPTQCGVSECGREASTMMMPWPTGGCCTIQNLVRIFRLMLVLLYIYINSTNVPSIMIINRIYETQNLLSL